MYDYLPKADVDARREQTNERVDKLTAELSTILSILEEPTSEEHLHFLQCVSLKELSDRFQITLGHLDLLYTWVQANYRLGNYAKCVDVLNIFHEKILAMVETEMEKLEANR